MCTQRIATVSFVAEPLRHSMVKAIAVPNIALLRVQESSSLGHSSNSSILTLQTDDPRTTDTQVEIRPAKCGPQPD